MTCDIQASGTVELYFYNELPPEQRADMQAHLNQCAICRHVLEDLGTIRAALASRPGVAAPPQGDWSALMERLDRLATERAVHRTAGDSADLRVRTLRVPVWRRVPAYAAMAAVLALVTASAIFVLRRPDSARAPDVTMSEPARPIGASARQPDPALMSVSESHFERSKLVVLGLATGDAGSTEPDHWPRQRELARTLLNDTRVYRLAAEERGMNTLAGVMRDLELVLLQTSMSEDPDADSIEQLQRLIRRRDLLTKMNLVATAGP